MRICWPLFPISPPAWCSLPLCPIWTSAIASYLFLRVLSDSVQHFLYRADTVGLPEAQIWSDHSPFTALQWLPILSQQRPTFYQCPWGPLGPSLATFPFLWTSPLFVGFLCSRNLSSFSSSCVLCSSLPLSLMLLLPGTSPAGSLSCNQGDLLWPQWLKLPRTL